MNLRRIKICFSFFILICLLGFSFNEILNAFITNGSRPQNLILISVDTLRPDHMSLYGYERATTPNIDKWANNAYVFDNVYTTVPNTFPSFATLMTGRNSLSTRIDSNLKSNPLSDNSQTLAKILQNNNYITTAFVTNRTINPLLSNMNLGFDQYHQFDGWGNFKDEREKYNNFITGAIEWIKNYNSPKNFFLWIHLLDPHAPYIPPLDLRCKFDNTNCPKLKNISTIEIREFFEKTMGCNKFPIPNDELKLHETLYDAEIIQADYLIGKIFKSIKENRLMDETMIVFYGDHGEGLDHNYYFAHGETLYNSSIRIPLIIKFPGISSKIRIRQMLDNSDILPTILDLLKVKPDDNKFDGRSFSGLVKNDLISNLLYKNKEYTYSVTNNLNKFSINDGRYKYIYSVDVACLYNDQKEELFDLKYDPNELNNIIEIENKTKVRLKKQLLSYLSAFNLPQNYSFNQKTIDYRNLERMKALDY